MTMKLNTPTCVVLFLMFFFTTSKPSSFLSSHNLAKQGCRRQCGEVIVPYPFGIGTNCSMNVAFTIFCNTSTKPPRAFFRQDSTLRVKLLSDSTVLLYTKVKTRCFDDPGSLVANSSVFQVNTKDTPLTFSKRNVLTLLGCNYYAWLSFHTLSRYISTGCMTYCLTPEKAVGGDCLGDGCCRTPMSKDVDKIIVEFGPIEDLMEQRNISDFKPCSHAFIGDKEFKFEDVGDFPNSTLFIRRIEDTVPMVFDWAIGSLSCPEVKKTHAFACRANSLCVNSTSHGYRCICERGYEGNPYLNHGCQDVNECHDPRQYPCHGRCFNTIGSYKCICPQGSIGDAHKLNGLVLVILALAFGVGNCWVKRSRKLAGLREKFFQANGGVLLQQKMNSQGCHEVMSLFTKKQLVKATNNFSQKRIIGKGGYGVVYKGVLSDNRVVAIKTSKLLDATQVEQFINEIAILTQVIHRHVVKLLGCCLEEEVPLLVYEYIPNNTLFYHLHHTPGGMSWLSWVHRLRIASEVASALAYLHSETIIPIVHRDIKSTNILLDANYTTKVSDFGASRLIPLNHEHVTTLIQGTLGYLDPEYFRTSQLTKESDVYSFGVVLAELITNKNHISVDRANKVTHLATNFVNSMKENRLDTIVEPRIWNEGSLEQFLAIGDLVKRCLNQEGHDRPTMKEVLVELDGLRKLTPSNRTRSQVLEAEKHDTNEC